MVSTGIVNDTKTALINPKVLFQEIGEDRELLCALVETARSDLPKYLEQLRVAAIALDYLNVKLSAHAMKTTLAHWEATRSLELTQRVELLCRNGKGEEAVLLVPSLDQAVREVLVALEKVEELL